MEKKFPLPAKPKQTDDLLKAVTSTEPATPATEPTQYPEKIELGENVKTTQKKNFKYSGKKVNTTLNLDENFVELLRKAKFKEEIETKTELLEHILTTFFKDKPYAREFFE